MKSPIYIEAFDCIVGPANSKEQYWKSLMCKDDFLQSVPTDTWAENFQSFWDLQAFEPKCSSIEGRISKDFSVKNKLVNNHLKNIDQINFVDDGRKTGIIYASTKGAIEDFIWNSKFQKQALAGDPHTPDPLFAVLESFSKKLQLKTPGPLQCVSNSCASSHGAHYLGKLWIENNLCERVIIIASDHIGPFILTGFQSLKALASKKAKPFQDSRDGLNLGEASTIVVLSKTPQAYKIDDIKIKNEVHAVTSPSEHGKGLYDCIETVASEIKIDLCIAHGTATQLNDKTEDYVFNKIQQKSDRGFYITGTKWLAGHGLGSSGSLDIISAILCLENQYAFSIPTEGESINLKAANYLFNNNLKTKIDNILITSLGFGGTNAACIVSKERS